MADAQIRAVITADDRASSVLRNFGNTLDKSVSNSLDAAKAGSFALLGGLTALAGGAALLVSAFAESENVGAQLTAVLKSTGGAAGVTREQALGLSQALQATTTFSDEAVLSAENLLLTFTSIGKDIFPQATKTVLDMSVALGQDTKSSAIQLGKALQDPITGITALRRVGVNFTDAQQDVIANLVNTNRLAEAQTMILAELNKEFGGSATEAAKTFTGQLKQLWNMINDVMEVMGKLIADGLRPFVQGMIDAFKAMGGADGVAKMLTDTLAKLTPYIPEIAGAIAFGLVPAIVAMISALGVLQPEFVAFLAVGALVGYVLKNLNLNFDDLKAAIDIFRPSLEALWQAITTNLWPALQRLGAALEPLIPLLVTGFVGAILAVINGLTALVNLSAYFINLVVSMRELLIGFIGYFAPVLSAFGAIAAVVGQAMIILTPAVRDLWATISAQLLPALQEWYAAMFNLWTIIGPVLGPVLLRFAEVVGVILVGVLYVVIEVLAAVIGVIARFIDICTTAVNSVIWWGNTIAGFVSGAINLINLLPGAFDRAFGEAAKAFSLLTNPVGFLLNNLRLVLDFLGQVGNAIASIGSGKNVVSVLHNLHVPGFAAGTQNFGGGLALVGERGPEIVNLPGGSDVIPNNKIGQMGGNTSINISLNGPFLGSGVEARAYAQMVVDNIRDIASAKNMTVAEVLG